MTNRTLIHMYENKPQDAQTLSLSLAHGLYYSLYLRKHAYLQTWGTTVESLGGFLRKRLFGGP